jgi:hypothetical protein
VHVRSEKENVAQYRKYIATLRNLLRLDRSTFKPGSLKIEELIAPDSMGRSNSIHQLQNYVVGLTPVGLTLSPDGSVDIEKSFVTVNYFELLKSQRVAATCSQK